VAPLLADGVPVGYADLHADVGRRLDARDVQLVSLLASQVACGIENARLVRSLEARTATDPLTGLYSGWYFMERLYAEVARARRYRQPLTLVMAEVDGLDRVRSRAGDEGEARVLQHVARILRASTRDKVDVSCRLAEGGFAVLLPNTPPLPSGAGVVAGRICSLTSEAELRDDDLGTLGRFTMSLGLAGHPLHAEDADDLMSAARAARDAALHGGGDRWELAGRG
jgi:diguanylate cyclase (GGDEF)-like protein